MEERPQDYLGNLTPLFEIEEGPERKILEEYLGRSSPSPVWRATMTHWKRLSDREQERVIQYCSTLDALHLEFDLILEEMAAATERYQADPNRLREMIVFHRDNFHLRVHAYREKVFQLVKHGFVFRSTRPAATCCGPWRGEPASEATA
jgi:hypothetical protein